MGNLASLENSTVMELCN